MKIKNILKISTLFSSVILAALSMPSQAASNAPGTLMHASSGKCLHPLGGSSNPNNGTKLVVWPDCSNDSRIKYKWLSNGAIQHVSSGKCLHPEGGSSNPTNGTRLVFWNSCSSGSRIAFELTDSGSIRHKLSGRCVHPLGGAVNPANETPMVLWDGCTGDRVKFQPGGERFIYIHGWTDDPRMAYSGAPASGLQYCQGRDDCNYWDETLDGFVRHVGWSSHTADWRQGDTVGRTMNILSQYCRDGETPCVIICHSTGCPIFGKVWAHYGDIFQWKITRVLTLGSAEGGSELGKYKNDNAKYITPSVVRSAYDHNDTHGLPFYHVAGDDGGIQSFLIDGDDDGVVGFHSSCGYSKSFDTSHCEGGKERYGFLNAYTRTVSRWTGHHRAKICPNGGCDADHSDIKDRQYQQAVLNLNP